MCLVCMKERDIVQFEFEKRNSTKSKERTGGSKHIICCVFVYVMEQRANSHVNETEKKEHK